MRGNSVNMRVSPQVQDLLQAGDVVGALHRAAPSRSVQPFQHETEPAARLPIPPTTPSEASPRTERVRTRRLAVRSPDPGDPLTRSRRVSASTELSHVVSVPNSPSPGGDSDEEPEAMESGKHTSKAEEIEKGEVTLPWINSQEAGSRADHLSRSSSLEFKFITAPADGRSASLTHAGGAATPSRLQSAVALDATINTSTGREQGLQRVRSLK